MKLEKIITMANRKVRIEFLAMERSLRATGCDLPIWVIPYNDDTFELPKGSKWWTIPEVHNWLSLNNAMPKLRKYQCFLTQNYQFVDADVCFLKNPAQVLSPYEGFITSCLHWNNPEGTYTEESKKYMVERTTIWPSLVFNSGQFASSEQLYDLETLKKTASQFEFTCIKLWRDQPSLNMMVFASGVRIQNLTLPPINMESTWAGDYESEYENLWRDESKKPYIIHWAGRRPTFSKGRARNIDKIFYSYLTTEELTEWKFLDRQKEKEKFRTKFDIKRYARKMKKAVHVLTT